MKQVLNFLLVFLISISLKAQLPKNNISYKMTDIAIQTRWAKEVNPANALKEYPRPHLQRGNWINLNGLWDYAISSKLETPERYDGNILVPFPLESALSGVRRSLLPEEVLWYHRVFSKPALKAGEKLILNFGAVSWEATIFVNDKEAGNHKGAYSAFALDITGLLKAGKNDIKVKVWNPLEKGIGPRGKQTLEPGGMWYTASSGIWQTVWLEKVPENHIKSIKVTPDVDKGVVNVVVNAAGPGEASVKVFDSKREVALSTASSRNDAASSVIVRKDNEANSNLQSVTFTIPIKNAKLWSPDSPFLYDLEITMGKDKVKSYFGMRKVEIKKDEKGIDRIFLNNKYAYNLGTLDQGFWPDGLYTAPTDEALKFDIEAIKAMGFNTIRKHIKVEPARWYYHADKLGILVWQDLVQPGGKLGGVVAREVKAQFEKESAEILSQFYNYPSITTWVLFNEGWGEYDQERLAKWVKQTDSTRLVNGHSGAVIVDGKLDKSFVQQIIAKSQGSDMTDIHSYPPPAIPNHIPGKAMVLGEFGGIGVQVEGHLWDDMQSVFSYGKTVSSEEMKSKYAIMVDSLMSLEKRGLSASIYTQPFDVEGEQNGLVTYDREVVKISVEDLRIIHAKLKLATKSKGNNLKKLGLKPADFLTRDYVTRLKEYKDGKKDSASLRTLALMAHNQKVTEIASQVSEDYIKSLNNPLAESNVKFIQNFVKTSTDPGYRILLNNLDKIRTYMDGKTASYKVQEVIYREEVKHLLTEDPDWAVIDAIIEKYPQIDGEFVLGNCVVYYRNANIQKQRNALKNFIEVATVYDNRYHGGAYNAWAWEIFESSMNKVALSKALEWAYKAVIETPEDANSADTYANLLYKLGRKEEAIKWEQKAVELNPDEPIFKETLSKIKSDIPTWVETK